VLIERPRQRAGGGMLAPQGGDLSHDLRRRGQEARPYPAQRQRRIALRKPRARSPDWQESEIQLKCATPGTDSNICRKSVSERACASVKSKSTGQNIEWLPAVSVVHEDDLEAYLCR
jgi:hypothetical protein